MTAPRDLGLPYESWNPEQWETIVKLTCSDKPVVLLEAPTGIGKSAIVTGLANLLDYEILVLTETIQLQQQYSRSLDYYEVKGRGNFPCLIDPVTADLGQCTVGNSCRHKTITNHHFNPPEPHEGCQACDESTGEDSEFCPYYYQKNQGERSRYAVLNYAYWLTVANYAGSFRKRSLVICDEAQGIEGILRNFATVSFSRGAAHYLDLPLCFLPEDDVQGWQEWAKSCRQIVSREYFRIVKNLAGPVTDTEDERRRKRIVAFVRACDLFTLMLPDEWVGDLDDSTGRIEFKPITVGPLAQTFMYRHLGDKTIMMSGTILDRDIFCRTIGLNPENVDFIRMPSTFPVENRPFYYAPTEKGSYADPDHVQSVVKHIDSLIDRHGADKGIIHTVSHALAGAVLRESRHTRRMITHERATKLHALDLFRRSPDGIWVSPSSTTGVDLPYDLCRWQIIAKLPFPNKGDKQIRKLMREDETTGRASTNANLWYTWTTACALIQAYGRGMRAPDDQCTTYLIDPNWKWFKAAARKFWPTWFREAWRLLAPQPVGSAVRPTGSSQQDVFALLKSLGIG